MTRTYYHGSFTPDIQTFHPFSHFGSREAAIHVVAREMIEGKASKPFLYEVKINMPIDKTIELADWNSPRPLLLVKSLIKDLDSDVVPKLKELEAEIKTTHQYKAEVRLQFFEKIKKLLLPEIRGIYYKNKHEGPTNETSLCVVCSETIVEVKQVGLSVEEIRDSANKIANKDTVYPRLNEVLNMITLPE
ncbi:hypothetical protein [Vibrio europaeus]|uniref:hypothetical protein n=1 Tax=Vibrio europaeus TaxID=300876 RepID=UPI00233F58F4|nr:hypothetical protein [Vibrio europaeus]MDC5855551.1 hypothetical protein [Vibrio europaeus]